jgi:hypothetical protein
MLIQYIDILSKPLPDLREYYAPRAKEEGRRFRREVAGLLRSDEHLRKLAAHDWRPLLAVLPRLVHDAAGKEAVARMQADGVDDNERLECLAGLFAKPYDEGGIWASEIAVRALAMKLQRHIFVVRVTNEGRIASFVHYSKEPPTASNLAYTQLLTSNTPLSPSGLNT